VEKKFFGQIKNGESVAYPSQTGALFRLKEQEKNDGANTTNLLSTSRIPSDGLPGKLLSKSKNAAL
jgi:hypothetical protein